MTPIELGTIAIRSTRDLRFNLSRNGEAWDGIDSVTLTFIDPDGTTYTRSAVLDSGNSWIYTTTITDFMTPGDRYVAVRAVDGVVDDTFPYEIRLKVTSQPPWRGCP